MVQNNLLSQFLGGWQQTVCRTDRVKQEPLVSRIVAAVVVTKLLVDQKRQIHLHPKLKLGFYPEMIRRILRIGIPNGLESSIFQIGKLMVAGLVSSHS